MEPQIDSPELMFRELAVSHDGSWRVSVDNLTADNLARLLDVIDEHVHAVQHAADDFKDPRWRAGFYAALAAATQPPPSPYPALDADSR